MPFSLQSLDDLMALNLRIQSIFFSFFFANMAYLFEMIVQCSPVITHLIKLQIWI